MAAIGEIIRGTYSFSHPFGSVGQLVFTWELQDSAESDAAVILGLENWFDVNWDPAWDPRTADNVIFFLAEYDVLNGDGTVSRSLGEEIHADPGDLAAEPGPPGAAGFMQANSERTKSYGRKYVPGFTETDIADGRLNGVALGEMVALLAVYLLDVDSGLAGILAPGILSRVTQTFQEFTGTGYASDVMAYQRRRKPGVGS